jgi:PilZ domain
MAQPTAQNDYDLRRAARHRADYSVIAESNAYGDQPAHIINISAHGFMIDNNEKFERGDRIELRLPVIGRIEAHLIWSVEGRAGFQFERVIRVPEFLAMLDQISPKLS